MAAFRDWPRTMRPASFRGVPFYVERDQVDTGRRLVVHEFPLKDAPYIEDMGRDTNKISVTAYVIGDDADAQEKALRSACERGGAASLSLPIDRFEVHCESCSRDFSKDKLGLVAFNLKFVREGAGAVVLPSGFLAAQVSVASGGMVSAVALWLASALTTVARIGFVRDAAASELRAIAGTIDVTARSVSLDAALGPAVLAAAADIAATADSLVRVGSVPHQITLTSFSASRPDPGVGTLVQALHDVLDRLRLAVEPNTGARTLQGLSEYDIPAPLNAPRTPTRRQAARNAEVLAQALRLLALASYAEAQAARTFADRRAAVQARADVAEYFAAEAERMLPGPGSADVHRALLTVSAALTEYLSRRISDLAPILTVEAPLAMPSLWWANRIYGGAATVGTMPRDVESRAADLVARNRVVHASFMPSRLEALAR